jgi:hypothetical protein
MKCVLSVLLLFVLDPLFVGAQTFRGAVNGTVTDPSGALVPNAQVRATEIATSVDHNTVTTADGQFSIQDLPPGDYAITVVSPGFAAYAAENAQVTAGSIYTVAVKLSLAQQANFLEVEAAALTVDATTSTQSDTIREEAVQNMPPERAGLHPTGRDSARLWRLLDQRGRHDQRRRSRNLRTN